MRVTVPTHIVGIDDEMIAGAIEEASKKQDTKAALVSPRVACNEAATNVEVGVT